MGKIKILLGILTCAITINLNAQQGLNAESKRLTALSQKLEGTYQLQIIDSREKIAMPMPILDSVQAKRNNTDIVYFWLKKNVRVKVLPYAVINRQDFIPLERVVTISSKNLSN